MRGHAEVRVGEPAPALGVGHPARVDVDQLPQEPALARGRQRALAGARLTRGGKRGPRRAEQHEVDAWTAALRQQPDGAHRRHGVEPAPQAAAPDEHPLARDDRWERAPQ